MTELRAKLNKPPIIEAIIDIDCDMPPNVKIEAIEKSSNSCFQQDYPVVQTRQMTEHTIESSGDVAPKGQMRHWIDGSLHRVRVC
jgi:uncharacterized protein (TIGR04255 family)